MGIWFGDGLLHGCELGFCDQTQEIRTYHQRNCDYALCCLLASVNVHLQ